MMFLFNVLLPYLTELNFYISWRDLIEIGIFSTFFYYCALWLKKDSDKNLLASFYGYIFFVGIAHFLQLSTLTSFIFLFSPAVAMLFMLMHQDLLQRNFVSLKNITIASSYTTPDWLSVVMKATLSLLTHNKDIIIVIEDRDALNAHLHCPELLDVPITDGLITLLFSRLYTSNYLCWLSSNGIIRGINVRFKASWHPASYQTKTAWIDDAVVYTAKTDAVILCAHADKHRYSVAHSGTITDGLLMEQAHVLVKKLIKYQIPLPKKGYSYGVSKQKKFAQHSP